MEQHTIRTKLGTGVLELSVEPGRPARLVTLGGPTTVAAGAGHTPAQSLVEVLAVGQGRTHMNETHINTVVGARLRPISHRVVDEVLDEVVDGAGWTLVEVVQHDEVTGLEVASSLRVAAGLASLQAWTTVRNTGSAPVVLEAVSSLAFGAFLAPGEDLDDVEQLAGRSTWLGEARYRLEPVTCQDGLVDLDLGLHQGQDRRAAVTQSSAGSWSSGTWMPTSALVHAPTGRAMAWQVEHNGSWTVEVTERTDPDHRALAWVALGPTEAQQWRHRLSPGESVTTVPVSVAVSSGGVDGAVGVMTQHRRRLLADRGAWPVAMPVVFNDYMNTLMGDPTTDKLLPLVDAAGAAGAEIFCIDAGWYSDDAGWWSSVGAWTPSTTRFPGGIGQVLDRIRDRGMVPGLWLEPEVVGVDSPLAISLPREAFLERDGVRVVEQGRYLLDLRDTSARKHLDTVVDRLVDELGVGFFKLDYNVTPGTGVDGPEPSPGANLLAHQRAVLDWLGGLGQRHAGLLLESCASGGMRQDFATVSRVNLQSTSDQQNPLLYPPITANSMVNLLPEQAGIWAYPQAGMTREEMVFTLAGALLGRLYLSGYLNRMDPDQVALVTEAVTAHQQVREVVARSSPVMPWGPAGWDDPWVSLALRDDDEVLLTLWARPGAPSTVEVPLDWLTGRRDVSVEQVFPTDPGSAWTTRWSPSAGALHVRTDGPGPQARVLRLRTPAPTPTAGPTTGPTTGH